MSSISKSGIAAPATMSPTRTMTWRRFGAMAGASTSTRMGGRTENKGRDTRSRALGLTSFGVNLTRLPPGTASALRHWHSLEDEFVMVLEGEATLITEAGETVLGPGMPAGFPKGKARPAADARGYSRPGGDPIGYPRGMVLRGLLR